MTTIRRRFTRLLAIGLATFLAATGFSTLNASIAAAELTLQSTVEPRRGVTADSLPTVQINGVVWALQIVGNTVFAGGEFTKARPAGAPSGSAEVNRGNFLAFNLTTGELIPGIDPVFNSKVTDMAVSADGATLYVVGSFTMVDGQNRWRIAAIDVATGELRPGFGPGFNATINSVAVHGDAVYVGGAFSKLGSLDRKSLAAVSASNGAALSWAPVTDGQVQGVAVTPDGSRVVVDGNFATINGFDAKGIGAVTAGDGTALPFPANQVIQNYGAGASNFDLHMASDGMVYGSGFAYGSSSPKFFEGGFAIDAYTGEVAWLADCHGDTYDMARLGDTVYAASHHHHCSNIGAFPDTEPRLRWQHMDAFTVESTGLVRNNNQGGYPNFGGQPAPSMLAWFPETPAGTFTGQGQAAWTLATNDEYLVMGGEFPSVNGTRQQGLGRFVVPEKAPNKMGPVDWFMEPQGVALGADRMRISWPANWDRDDLSLNYQVLREDLATPVCTLDAQSTFWERPMFSCVDNSVALTGVYRYRVVASDPDGNLLRTDWRAISMPATLSPLTVALLADSPAHYWRMNATGSVPDLLGGSDLVTSGNVSLNNDAAVSDDPALSFAGSNATAGSRNSEPGPDLFTIEAWFRTTSSAGGKIIGFGNQQLTTSGSYDRHLYVTNDGRVIFGVYQGNTRTLESAAGLNDGQWHHVAGTLSSAGMVLYVDGVRFTSRGDTNAAEPNHGYWRVGGDNLNGWPAKPTNNTLQGSIDEVAVYDQALSPAQIAAHYNASGRSAAVNPPPTDDLGLQVLGTDPLLYWRLDDSSGTTASDASIAGFTGIYRNAPVLAQSAAVQGSAVRFDGYNDTLASSVNFAVQPSYSHELWFNSPTSGGGRLIGVGNASSGSSANYDRQVTLNKPGTLTFTSAGGTLTTADSYNDGQWHHLVASHGPDGMRLFVDGVLVGSNDVGPGNAFVGYLRVGGDGSVGYNKFYFNGRIDEVAHYPAALDIETVRAHYRAAAVTRNQAPTAALAVACDPLAACQLTGSGTDPDGTIVGYSWDLGDGNTAEGPEVTHSYTASGTYTITLTVTDDQGASHSTSTEVVVAINAAPLPVFIAHCADEACTFDASGSSDPDGQIATLAWEFGDGASAEGATASHRYAESGVYEVELTVTDDKGTSATTSQQLTVTANQTPVPVIVATCADLTCTFDSGGSHDADGSITAIAWTLGDQTTSDQAQLTHSYAAPGSYEITLTLTDDDQATGTTSQQIEVLAPNQAPVASFTSASIGLSLTVDATGSTDADGQVVAADWVFGDGATGSGLTASHSYAAAGEYLVELTVTDDRGGTATTTSTITIEAPADEPPVASFTVAVSDLAIGVDASASSDLEGSIASYAWDFGDGTTGDGVTANHSFAAAGAYQVTLVVTDSQGATASASSTISVTEPVNQAPTAVFTHTVADLGLSVDASASTDPDGQLVSWAWDFGDGATASGVTANHGYATSGSYEVTLAVTDDRGAVVTATQTVTVTEAPGPVQPAIVAQDGFNRTAPDWGSAEIGGAWSYTEGATRVSTNGSTGVVTLPAAGTSAQVKLADVAARDVQIDLRYALEAPPTGNGVHQSLIVRQIDAGTDYRMTVWVPSDGLPRVNLTARVDGVSHSLGDRIVPGINYQAGQVLNLSLVAIGSQTTTLDAYVWLDGQPRPTTPALSRTDSSPELQLPGAVSLRNYATGSTTALPVRILVDDLLVTDLAADVVDPPANQLPTAAFSASVHELAVNFDAGASADPGGSLVGYAWDFGDGSTGSGVTVTHGYAAPGSYQVTLTVTDDRGDTATTSQDVVVVAAEVPGVLVASDGFGRQGSTWGSADLGGGWAALSGAGYFSTDGSSGLVTMPQARAESSIRLSGLYSDVRVQASFALDAQPTGNGVHHTLIARQINSGTDYRFTVYIAADGLVRVNLSARNAWATQSFGDLIVQGLVGQPGDVFNVAFKVTGAPTATLEGYIWKAGSPMPTSPATTATDSTAALQAPGRVGLANYVTGSVTNAPITVRWDDFEVRTP